MDSQKEIFRASEGDAWFERNKGALASRDMSGDPVCRVVERLGIPGSSKVLEIGCGNGARLHYLQQRLGYKVSGIEPSAAAVQVAQELGVEAIVGTADLLPFENSAFDMVIFGFCLYLCDDGDLFRIAQEADRVLRFRGWLLILDFDSDSLRYRPYHHKEGIATRKMSYKSMFLWHPMYKLVDFQKFEHGTLKWTDNIEDWTSVSVLAKQAHAA